MWHQYYFNEKKALKKKLESVGILLLKKEIWGVTGSATLPMAQQAAISSFRLDPTSRRDCITRSIEQIWVTALWKQADARILQELYRKR